MDEHFGPLERLTADLALSSSTPGFAALLSRGGDSAEYCVGRRDDQNRLITANSSFRIASITKQFTAVAVLQLLDREGYSTTAALDEFFPELSAQVGAISITHLLTHTSGLADFEEYLTDHGKPVTDKAVLNLIASGVPRKFEPGTAYSYSNTAYCLLAALVAKLSGTSFADYLQREIFSPAGMRDSSVGPSSALEGRAYGFNKIADNWVLGDQSNHSSTEGDGGIYSTVEDLARWQAALYRRCELLSPELLVEMTTPHVPTQYKDESYGFGVAMTQLDGTRVLLHHGVSTGFENALFYVPDRDLSIALLTNLGNAGVDTIAIGKAMLAKYMSEK